LWWFFWFTWPFLGLLAVHRALLGKLSVSGRIVWFPFLVALAVAVFGLGAYFDDEMFYGGTQMSSDGDGTGAAASVVLAFIASTICLFLSHLVVFGVRRIFRPGALPVARDG